VPSGNTLASALADHQCIPHDSVDRLIDSWQRVRPDLDILPVGIIARLGRIRSYFDLELERLFEQYGLSGPDFSVLVTLARLNEPGGVPQRRLMDELHLTSGTISVRIDRLSVQGLVLRRADPQDKRNTRISLTQQGRALFERVAPAHLENERRLLNSLSIAEADLLATLLRKLLVEYEGTVGPESASLHLGLTLAPAHVTVAMRKAVGLAPVAGLLVQNITDGGPAAIAGVQAGDVLVRSGRHELRSVAALYAAIETASRRGSLHLTLLRGSDQSSVAIALRAGSVREWSNRAMPRTHLV
jgi:DNA-binding MarR family transcriptional regulator